VSQLDALDLPSHGKRLREVDRELGDTDIMILAVGILGARPGGGEDPAQAVEVLQTNTVGAGSLLMQMGEIMAARGVGTIVVLSSVAAERPRRSNAVYGASKAGLDALARGIADRLWASGVRVLVVRPGFVFTAMTAGLKPAPMAVTPQQVAQEIVRALKEGRETVRAPRRLGLPMLGVRLMPRALLRRVQL
jgi:decaprenylphospho-beta-D-erythro-pentofuranosid-2-ulose 2-reductase